MLINAASGKVAERCKASRPLKLSHGVCAPRKVYTPIVQHRHATVHLYIWLALDSVEVLMQAVQQESQQLLAVLLAIPLKLRSKPPELVLEIGRRD